MALASYTSGQAPRGHVPRYQHPVDGRQADRPGPGLGQPGPGQRQARHHGVSLCCMVSHSPLSHEPWVIATNLPVSANALWGLYRDRWPIEQALLAATQMLGAHRAFVFGEESRYHLPELALLTGNSLADVAAMAAAVATGFWHRYCRPPCGRLRRVLLQGHFSESPCASGLTAEKGSVTGHPRGGRGTGVGMGASCLRPTACDSKKPPELPETKESSLSRKEFPELGTSIITRALVLRGKIIHDWL
jgi:hypothetical protein